MTKNNKSDVIVIGSGHNGLIVANYLAKAGLKVLIMERRLEAGGGLSTEEITVSGFLHNLHSYFHDTINIMPAFKDLAFEDFNARYYRPPVQMGTILPDGRALCMYDSREKTIESIARFSEKDAKKWQEVCDNYEEFIATVIIPALYSAPPPPSEQILVLEGSPEGMEWLRIMRMSPEEVCDEFFENDVVKAMVLHQLPIPRGVLPDYTGLGAIVPLIICQVEHSQIALSGSHTPAHAMWRALIRAGGDTKSLAHVSKILIKDGAATGVELESGEQYFAPTIISGIDLKQTFLKLVGREHLDDTLVDKIEKFRLDEFSVFGVHLALREAPQFEVQKGYEDVNQAFRLNIGFDSPADFTEVIADVRLGKLPEKLAFIASVPTLFDPSQAPEGFHTALIWQLVPRKIKGANWEDVDQEYMHRCIEKWREYAPNLTEKNIIKAVTQTPVDIANRIINMDEGGVFMGRMVFAQMEGWRPVPEVAQFRTPIKGLYMCGSCMHPGGGMIGGPGVIAADVIGDDLKLDKWWESSDY
jgi:phytoene dehydrogenase-like protein